MKIIFAAAVLGLMAFACNLCNMGNQNKNASNSNSMTMPTPAATAPAKTSLKDAFPQKVGDYTLQDTYDKSELKGDDKYLPGAEDVMGAVYKSSSNKKEQVMAGSYASASDATAAQAKKVPGSKYIARWTKGNILYVATDETLKDKL